jgi:hypothetical protein
VPQVIHRIQFSEVEPQGIKPHFSFAIAEREGGLKNRFTSNHKISPFKELFVRYDRIIRTF